MAVEFAEAHTVAKPWGAKDLRPWRKDVRQGESIGEIWFERPGDKDDSSELLLKLLFTTEPLSIQVHPTDEYARKLGLSHGKTEAWYILSATPDAKIALGLKQRIEAGQLRQSIADGSFSDLVQWRNVNVGDTIFVPAGTIHAIGAGLVIAEIQQRDGVTFRMFDYGRPRNLHVKEALTVANAGPMDSDAKTFNFSEERLILVSNTHFVFERIDLPAASDWRLKAEKETWLLFIDGQAIVDTFEVAIGDVIFAEADTVDFHTDASGTSFLVAYMSSVPVPDLLIQTSEYLPRRNFPTRAQISS